jgi:NosR/NirI family transcriptional regulator, nitrous oxide reductase regulator
MRRALSNTLTNPGFGAKSEHRSIVTLPVCSGTKSRSRSIVGIVTLLRSLAASLLLFCSSIAALGVERFPPPDFTSGYKLPITPTPPARADFLNYLDISVLAVALMLAVYLVIFRRSRRGIVGLTIFSLAYFGFYRNGCVCPIGAIQNVALAIGDRGYALSMVAGVFFLLPILFALFAGRVFCAAVCPLGAAQDVVLRKPAKLPSWLVQPLSVLPWIYLGGAVLYAATGTAFLICRYDPFVAFFRLGGSAGMLVFGAAMLGLGVFVGRPYCRFLCPYGALLRLVSPVAKWRVTITPDKCVQCRLCEESCPFGEIRLPTPQDSASKRYEGKGRLAVLLALLPVMILIGAGLGRLGGLRMSQVNPAMGVADRVWLEEHHQARGTTLESQAFYKQGQPNAVVYKRAVDTYGKFKTGGMLFGGWVGLVIGLKLIGLSIRRRRVDYEADSAGCVGCGRCYWSCPVERARFGDAEAIKLLEERA